MHPFPQRSAILPGKSAAALPADSWRILALMLGALVLAAALTAMAGLWRGADQRLEELSFGVFDRPASGQIHIVEMDAASMATIQRWPWPRDHYARVVSALDAAGARSISFDVDLSSAGDPAGDRALAEAIAAARAPVALATFAQKAGADDQRELDSLPIPILREPAHLASVSVAPDSDGYVRHLPLGTVTGGTARPSLASFVGGRSGTVDQHFPVDFAIRPDSIPRHSFVAVERGMIPPGSLEGKDVIIGATAIELFDRYAVPQHSVIPGVVVQAIAAETLARGVPSYGSWSLPLAIATLMALVVLTARSRSTVWVRSGAALVLLLIGWLAARQAAGVWFEIAPALGLVFAAGALRHISLAQRFSALRRQIDPHSQLPNRLGFEARAAAPSDRFVIVAQIDDFDALQLAIDNAGLGALLRRLAERLEVATGAGQIYRIEDRTLLWVSALQIDEIEAQLAGLRAIMRSPFEIAGRRLGVGLTFGVADCGASDPAARAAHAASLAKRAGKHWRLDDEASDAAASDQFSLLGELEGALESGQIVPFYQPKLNLRTKRIDAVEALVRWQHPERGFLPPDCFIPLFEEAGRIDDLTLAVLRQSLADMRRWREAGLEIGAAVNISAVLLSSESFATRALALVEASGMPAGAVTFEVTESAQFEDVTVAIATLERFRARGIRISMDDYGTGQSTLNYIKLLPLSELKIDRMFVANAHADRGDALLVRSTIQLAHELGLKVVAEGIEEAACLAFLEGIGCDYAQGYFIGRPLKADDLAALAAAYGPKRTHPLPVVAAA
ncbi:EAL domain-containing protein [Porphyrobacter sp. YT40]|uniref:EAL domain-containing protein n=1 Tax=Porphyrobacter sp. YT40 TaxID=2547601 RepID=UPI00114168F9|nr:EAL domain-containing protein [Porphyrobacter sp. YT40]QDH33128.1 EAL domain-containing protein [Porphyrobacter sp. YT40]